MKKYKLAIVILIGGLLSLVWMHGQDFIRLGMARHCFNQDLEPLAVDIYKNFYRKKQMLRKKKLQDFFVASSYCDYFVISELVDYYKRENDILNEEKYLIELIDLRPEITSNYVRLYNVYQGAGRTEEAVGVITKYEKINSRDLPIHFTKNSYGQYKLGLSYLHSDMLEKAKKAFKTSLSENGSFAEAHYLLGYIYEKQGSLDMARMEYEKTVDLLPAHIEALKNLVRISANNVNGVSAHRTTSEIKKLSPANEARANFLNKIQFLGYGVERIDKERIELKFWFKSLDLMNKDYLCVIRFEPENAECLPQERRPYGAMYSAKEMQKNTSYWQIGEVYVHEYTPKIAPGKYNIKFFLKYPAGKGYPQERLKDVLTNKNSVDLGWIDIK
ncbi:MAG: hypothetical protein ISS92_00160 [Candidatus Omnitrophica bacterium]|nr:hypothetical protein [Candidatus Omnitrophota bacterium]